MNKGFCIFNISKEVTSSARKAEKYAKLMTGAECVYVYQNSRTLKSRPEDWDWKNIERQIGTELAKSLYTSLYFDKERSSLYWSVVCEKF